MVKENPMKRDLTWLIKWAYRQIRKPFFWATSWVSILIGSLATEKNPLEVALWTGPIHILIASWIATVGLLVSLLHEAVRRFRRHATGRVQFYRETTVSGLKNWVLDEHWLPFDGLVELCVAPNLLEPDTEPGAGGWTSGECKLSDTGEFVLEPRFSAYLPRWSEKIDPEKLKKDGTKYVLVNNPDSETDEHFVRLMLRRSKWSHVQSFLHQIKPEQDGKDVLFGAADPEFRRGIKPKMDLTKSQVPHALCLHGVVVTVDKKVLAFQRPGPDRTDYHPHAWSFSFEEQLADKDFDGRDEVDVSAWLVRSVRQEVLGNEVNRYFKVEKARILSIAVEESIFNPFLVAYLPIECDSIQLAEILPNAPDHVEWLRYAFYTVDPPFSALAAAFRENRHTDGNSLHPTSRYRIYLALTALIPPTIARCEDLLRQEHE